MNPLLYNYIQRLRKSILPILYNEPTAVYIFILRMSIHKYILYLGCLYFLSSTLNPLLYNLMSAKYREAFKTTFCRGNKEDDRTKIPAWVTQTSTSTLLTSTVVILAYNSNKLDGTTNFIYHQTLLEPQTMYTSRLDGTTNYVYQKT